jgi:hypothetical protein
MSKFGHLVFGFDLTLCTSKLKILKERNYNGFLFKIIPKMDNSPPNVHTNHDIISGKFYNIANKEIFLD